MEQGFNPRWSATFHTGSREMAGFACLATDVNQDTFPEFPPPCQICFLLRLYRHIPSVSTVRSISIRHLSTNLLSSCHFSFINSRTCRTVVPGAKSREAAAEKDPKSSGHNEKDGDKWCQKEKRQRWKMTADSLTGLTHKWESHWWSAVSLAGWTLTHENLCSAWTLHTCGTSAKAPCHARVLKSPWWWALLKYQQISIHNAQSWRDISWMHDCTSFVNGAATHFNAKSCRWLTGSLSLTNPMSLV